jgi:hypothetical protein
MVGTDPDLSAGVCRRAAHEIGSFEHRHRASVHSCAERGCEPTEAGSDNDHRLSLVNRYALHAFLLIRGLVLFAVSSSALPS